MTVTLIPINGGYIKNFKLYGEGGRYDDVACEFKQGFWSNGKLNGATCQVTNYFSAEVNIKKGVYSNDLANGAIEEYTFPKTDWDTFVSNPEAGIDSTKYTRVYTNGVLTSTSATVTQKIKGEITYNVKNNIIDFAFSEVV